jgi:hypothetical protein
MNDNQFNVSLVDPTTATTATWTATSTNCSLYATLTGGTAAVGQSLTVTPAATTVFISCSVPGTYGFSVYPDALTGNTDSFAVTVTAGSCYRWHFVVSNAFAPGGTIKTGTSLDVNEVSPSATLTARLWIIDPASSSPFELLGTASEPSTVRLY